MTPIPNFENQYAVMSDGSVYSIRHQRTLKISQLRSGYKVVNLNINGSPKTFYHHRLVAETLIPNPFNHVFVNHKDKDRGNNHPSNLEWVTRQQNNEHGMSKHYVFKNPKGELVRIFNLSKFSREHGLDCGCMVKVSKGERQSHRGWRKP